MVRKIGGGVLTLVSIAVPVIVDKMDIHLTTQQGTWLLIGCGGLALVGLALVFWPAKKPAAPPSGSADAPPHARSTTVRARGNSKVTLEDSFSTAHILADVEENAGFETKRVVHDPAGTAGRAPVGIPPHDVPGADRGRLPIQRRDADSEQSDGD